MLAGGERAIKGIIGTIDNMKVLPVGLSIILLKVKLSNFDYCPVVIEENIFVLKEIQLEYLGCRCL